MSETTTWLYQETDDGQWRYPRYPARVPVGGVKKYFWNSKCLVAPKPYFDKEGYYYWRNWVTRKVIPGLLNIPEPIKVLSSSKDIVSSLRNIINLGH